jgi:hypothetical protein
MSRKKIILGRDTYEQLKSMLESPDQENAIVALSCIEASDFKSNITYVLLMMHEADIDFKMWKEHAAETIKKYTTLGISGGSLNYKKILNVSLMYNCPLEDIQFFMDRLALHMKEQVNLKILPGERVIKELKIQINPNEQSRTISKSLKRSNVEGTLLRDVSDNAEQEMG